MLGLVSDAVEPPRQMLLVSAIEETSPLARNGGERQIAAPLDDELEHAVALAAGQHRGVAHERRRNDCRCQDKRECRGHPVDERDDARREHRRDDKRPLEQELAPLQHTHQGMIGTQKSVRQHFLVGRVKET